MFRRDSTRDVSVLAHDVDEAARAAAAEGDESLARLRFILLRLLAGLAAIALSLVSIVGTFPGLAVRLVLVATAIGCVVVFVSVQRNSTAGSRLGLLLLSALMGVAALIAATIQPAPLGTITGFVFLGFAVCIAATESVRTAIIFAALALALGLTAITFRSTVAGAAATVFTVITVLAVYVVIRFRMIVSDARDRAVADALTDPLTGLGNRRRMDLAVTMLGQIAERSGQSLGCLTIDIDHFKRVNDESGHDAGDEVLRATADTIADNVRRGDLVVRLGGDEFAVFTIVSNRETLEVMGERIRAAMETSTTHPMVTVSVGGAMTVAVTDEEVKALLSASDRALYEAKQSGRNALNVVSPTAV